MVEMFVYIFRIVEHHPKIKHTTFALRKPWQNCDIILTFTSWSSSTPFSRTWTRADTSSLSVSTGQSISIVTRVYDSGLVIKGSINITFVANLAIIRAWQTQTCHSCTMRESSHLKIYSIGVVKVSMKYVCMTCTDVWRWWNKNLNSWVAYVCTYVALINACLYFQGDLLSQKGMLPLHRPLLVNPLPLSSSPKQVLVMPPIR